MIDSQQANQSKLRRLWLPAVGGRGPERNLGQRTDSTECYWSVQNITTSVCKQRPNLYVQIFLHDKWLLQLYFQHFSKICVKETLFF